MQQFINRIQERRQYQHAPTNTSITPPKYVLKKQIISAYPEALLNDKMVSSFNEIQIKYMTFGVGLKNNHCILIRDLKTVAAKIEKIVQCIETKNIYFIVKEYVIFKNYFNSPCPSRMFNCGIVDDLSVNPKIVPIESILTSL